MSLFKALLLLALTSISLNAAAELYVSPAIGAGYNSLQGANYSLGVDIGYRIDENWVAGVGGFYSFGQHPNDDRAFGFGPFVGYVYPLLSWLNLNLREDVDFIDQRDPYQNLDGSWASDEKSGMASFTYVGLHISITQNFGISGGYRWGIALSRGTAADDLSGPAFGLTLGL